MRIETAPAQLHSMLCHKLKMQPSPLPDLSSVDVGSKPPLSIFHSSMLHIPPLDYSVAVNSTWVFMKAHLVTEIRNQFLVKANPWCWHGCENNHKPHRRCLGFVWEDGSLCKYKLFRVESLGPWQLESVVTIHQGLGNNTVGGNNITPPTVHLRLVCDPRYIRQLLYFIESSPHTHTHTRLAGYYNLNLVDVEEATTTDSN
ncbi:hypothetical protein J6590_054609 [Homalodisca vitripennis]|nr:hypothetical protein J6590_054609 [Homalodisca vitripennis]